MSEKIFVYGTLQLGEVMEAVVGRRFDGAPARLPGHRRRRVHARTYPAIVQARDESTDGVVFSGVDDESLVRLDAFEGSLYVREWVTLETGDGAWAYVIAPENEHLLSDQPWDPEEFRLEHGEAFLEECKRWREEGVE